MEEHYGEILIYQSEDGVTSINVKMQDETVWLTQQQLVELYQSSKANVSEHIKHIFEEGELDEESVVRKFRTTASDGKTYNTFNFFQKFLSMHYSNGGNSNKNICLYIILLLLKCLPRF